MADERTFIKLHDGMPDHPKIEGLSDKAFRGLVIAWCSWAQGQPIASDLPGARALVARGLVFRRDGALVVGDMDGLLLGIGRAGARASIPRPVRLAVYERDGWACLHCGETQALSLDHIVPWSKGGMDDESNLQTLCMPCNQAKGARQEELADA